MDRTVEIAPSPPPSSSSSSPKIDGQGKRKPVSTGHDDKPPRSHWRNAGDQQIYSSNLLRALHRLQSNRTSSSPIPSRTRQVREAADRVLAAAARGRTRWSRAVLLSHRRSVKIKTAPKRRISRSKMTSRRAEAGMENKNLGVEGKARVLGRLVPGCRKLSFPSLLEETTDYIAALEMQVKVMAKLAEILSAAGGGGGGVSPAGDR